MLALVLKTFILVLEEGQLNANCVIFKTKSMGRSAIIYLRSLLCTSENATLPSITSPMPPKSQRSSTTHALGEFFKVCVCVCVC